MWPHSHLLVSAAVFGPSPESLAGGYLPDIFSNLNWANKFITGKVTWTLMRNKNKTFINTIDTGTLWKAHLLTHSLWSAIATLMITLYFYNVHQLIPAIFFASFLLHLIIDYFTHEDFIVFYPWKRKIHLKIIRFDPSNPIVEIIGNMFLLLIIIARLILHI